MPSQKPGPSPIGPYAGGDSAKSTDTMARWAERLAGTPRVPGSNPGGGGNLGPGFGLLYCGSTTVCVASRQPQYAILPLLPRMRGPRWPLPQGGLGISCFFGHRGLKKQEIPKPRVPLACATGRQWTLISPFGPPLFTGGQSYSLHVEQTLPLVLLAPAVWGCSHQSPSSRWGFFLPGALGRCGICHPGLLPQRCLLWGQRPALAVGLLLQYRPPAR